MNYVVFYLKDPQGPVPIGMVVYGRISRVIWFFSDAERDIKSDLWFLADKLFFKLFDEWDIPYGKHQEEYWNVVRTKLPPDIILTQPKPLTSLLELGDCVICPAITATTPGD